MPLPIISIIADSAKFTTHMANMSFLSTQSTSVTLQSQWQVPFSHNNQNELIFYLKETGEREEKRKEKKKEDKNTNIMFNE